MFEALAKERHKRAINTLHNKLIRESVLDLEEDEEGNIGIDSAGIIMDNEDQIPDEVMDSVEAKVDDIIKGKDVSNMSDEELDAVADQIIAGLDGVTSTN